MGDWYMSRQLTTGVLGQHKIHPLFQYLIEGYKMDGNSNGLKSIINGDPVNVTYATGKVGDAAVFNGTAHINLGQKNAIDLHPTDDETGWTISLWENTSTSGGGYFLSKAPSTTVSTHQFSIYRNTDLRYVVGGNFTTTGFQNRGVWNHIVLRKNPNPSTTVEFIVNKVSIRTTTAGTVLQPDTDVLLGARRASAPNSGIGFQFNGLLDEVYFFNKALTNEEIDYLYDNPL